MKLGVIGTGRIAYRFVPEAKYAEGVEIVSVYNPNKESAERYAEKWGIKAFHDADYFYQISGEVEQKATQKKHIYKSDKNCGL